MNLRKMMNETRRVSTESNGNNLSAILRFFSNDDHVVKPGETWKFSGDIEKLIQEKFGNDEWLSKQTFVEGQLDGSKFTTHLTKGGHVPSNVAAAVRHDIKSVLEYAKRFQPKLLKYIREVEKVFDSFRKDTNEDNAAEKRREIKNAVLAISTNGFRDVKPNVSGFLGDPKFNVDHKANSMYEYAMRPTDKIAALDKGGIKEMSTIILEIARAIEEIEDLNSDYWSSGIQDDDHFLSNLCFMWGDDKALFNIVNHTAIMDTHDRVVGLEKHLRHIAHDINRWMAASIK